MKHTTCKILLTLAMLAGTVMGLRAQTYSVDWFKVADGGGTSTGGVYTATVTIGQQEAGGSISGGIYTVTFGFWSLLGQGAPALIPAVPVITSQPQSLFVNIGNPALFIVSVTGTPPLFYQWQKNGVNLTDGGNISGSTNANLALSTTTTNDVGSYSVVIHNAYGNLTNSSVAKLTLILLSTNVITFDDLTHTTNGILVPNVYAGLSWNNLVELDGVNVYGAGLSGYAAGVVSPFNVVYNAYENPAYFYSDTPFNFVSAYLTAAWTDNLQVKVIGYAGASIIYDQTNTLSATAPTLINFNYFGVTEVYFKSFGGTHHSGYGSGSGEQFVMDNVAISTNMAIQPKFQTMTATGGNSQFSWNTVNTYPAIGYQVQYTTNLSAPNWINLGGVLTGTNATLSATNSIGINRQRFYRVLLVQ